MMRKGYEAVIVGALMTLGSGLQRKLPAFVGAWHMRMILALAVLLVWAAFTMRAIDVDRRPLSFDEGNNIFFGLHSPEDVFRYSRLTFDTDPPGHRFVLGLWMDLVGPSPFVIRFLSISLATLAVALLYRVMRVLRLPASACLVGVFMLAFSPFAIEYSQQAKGYALELAMALLSWWAWIRVDPSGRNRRTPLRLWVGYVISTGILLSTHYYALPVVAMQWLWWLASRMMKRQWPITPGAALRRIIAQVVACMPAGVWFLFTFDTAFHGAMTVPTTLTALSPFELLRTVFGEMCSGQYTSETLASAGALILGLVVLYGAVRLWQYGGLSGGTGYGAFWFGTSLFVPLLWSYMWQQRVNFFNARFLLYATPNVYVLAAGCALPVMDLLHGHTFRRLSLGAIVPGAGLAAVLVAGMLGITIQDGAPIDTRNDFRPLLITMRPLVRPGDAALGTYIWMEGIFTSYMPETRTRLHWYMDVYTPSTVERLMTPIAMHHRRVWALSFRHNPDALSALSVKWLRNHAARAFRLVAGDMWVLLFTNLQGTPTPPGSMHMALFDRRIRLTAPAITGTLTSGDTVDMTLIWTALQAVPEEDVVYVHVLAPDGRLVAQNDGYPVNGLAPSYTWQPGHPVIDRRAILIPSDAPVGTLSVWVGLYRRSDGRRLHTSDGSDGVWIGAVQVTSRRSQ